MKTCEELMQELEALRDKYNSVNNELRELKELEKFRTDTIDCARKLAIVKEELIKQGFSDSFAEQMITSMVQGAASR